MITLKTEFAPLSEGKKICSQDQEENEFNTYSGDEVLRSFSNQIVKQLQAILNSLEGVESKLERIVKKVEFHSQWAALQIQLSAVFAICVQTFLCLCYIFVIVM